MVDIKVGDWIKVPKGSHLIRDYGKGKYGEGKAPTSRDVVVQVSNVCKLDTYYAGEHGDPELLKAYNKVRYENPYSNTWGRDITDETRERHRSAIAAAHDALLASIPGQPKNIICWSKGNKGVLDTVPELVAAPPPKKKSEPKINKRQQMVLGSRWKVTEDVTICYKHANPAVIKGEADWEAANPRPLHRVHGTMDQDMAWRERVFAERKRLQDLHGEHIIKDYLVLKAGDIVKVAGKFISSWNPGHHFSTPYVSNVAPLVHEGHGDQRWGVEYKQIEPFIEAEEIPIVNVYVLREKATGKFYKSSDYNEQATEAAQKEAKAKGAKLYGIWHECAVYDPTTVESFMKAKHFDGLGRAKTQILMMTGYYDGLPGADESLPEWAGGAGFKLDTNDWELVHFDKLARKEVGVVQDFAEWYKRAWELRELTVRYGSSVRTTYKALEKANLLDKQKGMIVFTVTDEDKLDNVSHWGDRTALTDEDKKEIELATASLTKGTFKKAIDTKSMAVSFPNKGAALMFKLSYAGNLKVSVIDLEEMKEAVDG